MLQLKPLSDQVIVITGASSGIGLVTARMAAARGAKVVLAARNTEALDSLAREIEDKGGQALAVTTDVGVQEQVEALAKVAIERFGRFDTWVNDAGVSIFGMCTEVSIEDMRRMYDTNFWGTVYGCRAAAHHYTDRGEPGAIINVGSFFGDRSTPVQSTYASSKFAVHGWTDALRMELRRNKAPVAVTLVHPGRIDTPYNKHARSYMEKQPAHRDMIYAPEAVAEAILFAAEHEKRDFYVGSQAKIAALVGTLAPRFSDWFMERYMWWSQTADRPSTNRPDRGLWDHGQGLKERGSHAGWVRNGPSLYVRASMHPALTAGVLAGAGFAVATALRSKGRRRTRELAVLPTGGR